VLEYAAGAWNEIEHSITEIMGEFRDGTAVSVFAYGAQRNRSIAHWPDAFILSRCRLRTS